MVIVLYQYPESIYQNISSFLAKLLGIIQASLPTKIALPPVRLELTAFRL